MSDNLELRPPEAPLEQTNAEPGGEAAIPMKTISPGRFLSHAEKAIQSVQFSGDGSRLLGVDYRSAQVWDVATGRTLALVQARRGQCFLSGAISPDGSRFATGCQFEGIEVFDVETSRSLTQLPPDQRVAAVDFSADGRVLISLECPEDTPHSARTRIRVWNPESGEQRVLLEEDAIDQGGFVHSAAENCLYVSGYGGVERLELDGKRSTVWQGDPLERPHRVKCVSAGGEMLVVRNGDGLSCVIATKTRHCRFFPGNVINAALNFNGDVVAACVHHWRARTDAVRFFRTHDCELIGVTELPAVDVFNSRFDCCGRNSSAFHPEGSMLAVGRNCGVIDIVPVLRREPAEGGSGRSQESIPLATLNLWINDAQGST